jgi:hypothetical protein
MFAQTPASDSLLPFFQFDDPSPLSCLEEYFPPLFIQHGIELKSFIRSKNFRLIRERFGDVRAVDAIYIRAMQMTNNNTAMALLMSTIACFDHQFVGINVPIISLCFPLSNESDQEFARRVKRLPARLYPDSPTGEAGDRDKLQHFLGSAFLTVVFESRDATMRFGDFVEEGEAALIVGGIDDDRDRRADYQGGEFGLALLDDNHRLPSEFLRFHMASKDRVDSVQQAPWVNDVPLCSGVW